MTVMEHLFEPEGCTSCLFLGHYNDPSGMQYDLYYCPQRGDPTVIARYGERPEEYISSMRSGLNPLRVARARAMARGFVKHVIYHPYDFTQELWETRYEDLSKRNLQPAE